MTDEKTKRNVIECPHYKGEGFVYEMSGCELLICEYCNLLLAGEVMKQLAITTYMFPLDDEDD